jgi:natural product precursor
MNRKLKLRKETISRLDNDNLKKLIGGRETYTEPGSCCCIPCDTSDPAPTIFKVNC